MANATGRVVNIGNTDLNADWVKALPGNKLERKVHAKLAAKYANEGGDGATIEIAALELGGEMVPIAEILSVYLMIDLDQAQAIVEAEAAKTKTVNGKARPKGDFLVVEDPDKPTTWRLPVKVNGTLDRRLCGAAWAALFSPGGHRGQKYAGPDKAKAGRRLKAIYKSQDWELPGTAPEAAFTERVEGGLEDYAQGVKDAFRKAFIPQPTVPTQPVYTDELWPRDVLKDHPEIGNAVVIRDGSDLYAVGYAEAADGSLDFDERPNWKKVVLAYKVVGPSPQAEAEIMMDESAEAVRGDLTESASGFALDLAESSAVKGGTTSARAPLMMDVVIIEPGWGNKKDNRYYGHEVLERDAKVFEGVKMYTTDHKPGEKSVRTEVSVVKGIKGFTSSGAPIAAVAVHDPDFAEGVRNRSALGTLDSLECSILGTGTTRKGKVDGRKGSIVEAITSATSVDWVTKAGAGGRAINLAEKDKGGNTMPNVGNGHTEGGTQTQEPAALPEKKVEEILSESRLPEVSQKRLAESGPYADENALNSAILTERTYVKKVTGSGRPFAQGGSQTRTQGEEMSEADYDAAYDAILVRHGLPVQEVT